MSLLLRSLPALLAGLLLFAPNASAHLALLRQGQECGEVPNVDDKFGSTVAAGDFNRDGYEDLATAASWESNSLINAEAHGVVHINYGTSLGLTHVGADILSPGAPLDGSVKFGSALAVGDFNGDNYDDLAVGAPSNDFFATVDAGAVWIYDGYSGGIQLAHSALFFQSDIGAANEDYDLFGWALSAGDFNNDGFDDLAIGGIGENDDMGGVYVMYSAGASGLDSVGADIFTPNALGHSGPETVGGWFGFALASGDLDQDEYDDLVIGAPHSDVGGFGNAGRLYVMYGSNGGITTSGDWVYDNLAHTWSALDASLELGWSLVIGHFQDPANASPLQIAVGAPGYAHNGNLNAGGVIWLTHDDLTRAVGPQASMLVQDSNLSYDDVQPGDRFGEAVAAGRFDADAWDDLAIGVVSDNIEEDPALGQQGNSGSAYIRLGGTNGWTDNLHITHMTLNDHVTPSDQLGAALAFGRFDSSGRDGLAIGCPGGDRPSYDGGSTVSNAGRAYLHAPWRQARDLPHRGSAAFDCQGRLVYSQRAWQRLRPASTTKTMTLQLACEDIANGQNENQFFTVPAWVANSVGGSQAGLIAGEQLSYHSLMKTMMTVSGNDSAMLLGGIMSGEMAAWNGWSGTSPSFAVAMENKATQLGLSGATSLTNAAGIDSGDHYVTPYDWAWLSYQTIQDPCVREIVNTSPWVVTRLIPPGFFGNFLNVNVPLNFIFNNGFVDGVKAQLPTAVGNKGGQTPGALRTGIYNSDPAGLGGTTAAGGFGVWDDDDPIVGITADCNSCIGAELLAVADAACQDAHLADNFALPEPPATPTPWGTLTNWEPIVSDPPTGLGFQIGAKEDGKPGRITQIDVLRGNYTHPTANYKQVIHRTSDLCLSAGEFENWGIAPYQQHNGFRVVNRGESDVELLITASDPVGYSQVVTLQPEQDFLIAPANGSPAPSFTLRIENLSTRGDACIEVEELGYFFQIMLGTGGSMPDFSSIALTRALKTYNETVQIFLEGLDETEGNLLDMSAHDANSPTSIGDDDFTPGAPLPVAARLLPNHPNPFNPSTTLRFDLERSGPVDLSIYDAQGRLVRTLSHAQHFESGRHELRWSGDDDAGRRVSSGVYYLKLIAGSTVDSQRLVMVK